MFFTAIILSERIPREDCIPQALDILPDLQAKYTKVLVMTTVLDAV
jgi:hypothetical protein